LQGVRKCDIVHPIEGHKGGTISYGSYPVW
jgi:hypothetical protein